jgi:hypothetical protein
MRRRLAQLVLLTAAAPTMSASTIAWADLQAFRGYSVITPAGYSSSTARYPVVYLLPTSGGSSCADLQCFQAGAAAYIDQLRMPSERGPR